MKVVILAGGFGTRLSEVTGFKPKPMVEIGGHPILWHIMNIYAAYGYNDFVLALGFKAQVIKEYFLNYHAVNSDFSIDLSNGQFKSYGGQHKDWKVTLVDTGLETMTGGRIKRLKDHLKDEPFLLTYGDGVSDINIKDLVQFHQEHGKMITISGVHPKAHYGELDLENNLVRSFMEKPEFKQSWINGGFMVIQPEFMDLIDNDQTVLEREPMEEAASREQMMAYQHSGFWQCMDTLRDNKYLNQLWSDQTAPWKIW
jgi:glucose-1-phosphate cytidylyltransferase